MLLIGLSFGIVEQANGQCTNTTSFGSATINTSGTVVTITTCAFAGEYSTINGAVAGQTLRFTSSISTDFITIRSGTPGGPVLAFGQTPVEFANTFTGTIYAHWNTDASCGTNSSCRTGTVQCTSCLAPPPPAPANDLCANAIPIACGSTASGTTVNATVDNVTGGTCGTSITAPGVWYTFTSPGTGNATVSLCGSSFDTKISVFSGTCGSLVCIGGNDDSCGLQSQLTFSATNGTTYYVLVHGFSSSTGSFTLSLTCPAPPVMGPANDLCANAAPISCGQTLSGTTVGATNTVAGSCGVSVTSADVWYVIGGTGGDITVSTCNQASFDTKLSVFSGSCGALLCIGGNDDAVGCSLTSEFTFPSTVGTNYYILVHGFSSQTGTFDLTATCAPAPVPGCTDPTALNYNPAATVDDGSCVYGPANDLCANAAAISCGQTLSGTTVGATVDNVGTCTVSNTSAGVWYSFTGTGTPATVSTCSQASFDTKLSVFTGSCGALVCVGGNDDFSGCSGFTSQFTFPTTAGTTYRVLVHGFGSSTGTFSLSLTCAPVVLGCTDPAAINYNPNANTDDGSCIYPPVTCAEALAVGVGTYNTGSINSGNGASNICTFPISGNATHARWYTFTPVVSGEYTIGSAGLTSVDTRLSIHTGSCGDLACYASNDDVGGGSFASQVTECFTAGTTYYIEWDNRWSTSSFNWSIAFNGVGECGDDGGLPEPWACNGIGSGDGTTFCSYDNGQFTINTGAANNSLNGDNLGLIEQFLCGDFTITARVVSVSANSWAGLTVREDGSMGSRMVAEYSNLGSVVRWESRMMPNMNKVVNLFQRPFPYWLRLVRQGNTFIGYYSSNGVNFSLVNIQSVPMNSCVTVAMAGFSNIPGQPATVVFSNVAVTGGQINIAELPGNEVIQAPVERNISLFPNPARDIVTIDLGAELGFGQTAVLRLRNDLGQLLEERRIDAQVIRTEMNVSRLIPGIYFIEVHTEGTQPQMLRFVKSE